MDEGKSYNISVILTDMAGNESRSDDFWIVSDGSVAGLLDITMINVGWGDSHLIITPSGTKILIDGGADGKLAGITSYLDRKGVSGVDHMVLTHLHWDHYWGLTNYLIGALHSPDLYDAEPHAPSYTGSWADREIQDILDLYGIEEVNPSDGEFLDWDDDVTFRVLCSGNKWPSEDNENHSSIVIMVTLDDFDMILSGDAEFPNEDFMRSRYGSALKAEVLKVGHHGNDDATSPEYVSVVSPIAALIPVDPADVDNAMPDLSVMNILKDAGTDIFCSYSAVPYENDDEVPGNVEVLTDGKTFTIKVMATN
jgi:competence protein ComEC